MLLFITRYHKKVTIPSGGAHSPLNPMRQTMSQKCAGMHWNIFLAVMNPSWAFRSSKDCLSISFCTLSTWKITNVSRVKRPVKSRKQAQIYTTFKEERQQTLVYTVYWDYYFPALCWERFLCAAVPSPGHSAAAAAAAAMLCSDNSKLWHFLTLFVSLKH